MRGIKRNRNNEREIWNRYAQYLVSFFATIPLRSYYFFPHSLERFQRAGRSGRSYLSLLTFVPLRTLERKTHVSLLSLLPLQSYRTLDDNEFRIVRNNIDTISYDDDGDRCLQVGHARPSILEIRVLLAVPVDPGALSHRRYRAHPFDPRGICRRNLADPFAPSAQEDLENRGDRPLRDNLAHQAHPESIRIVR